MLKNKKLKFIYIYKPIHIKKNTCSTFLSSPPPPQPIELTHNPITLPPTPPFPSPISHPLATANPWPIPHTHQLQQSPPIPPPTLASPLPSFPLPHPSRVPPFPSSFPPSLLHSLKDHLPLPLFERCRQHPSEISPIPATIISQATFMLPARWTPTTYHEIENLAKNATS